MKVLEKLKEHFKIVVIGSSLVLLGIGGIIGYKINESTIYNLKNENFLLKNKVDEANVWFEMDIGDRERIKELYKEGNLHIAYGDYQPDNASNITKAEEVSLSPGNYIVGTDFIPGKYNVLATNGNGNVILDDGNLNEILHSDGIKHPNEFKNVDFVNGAKFKVLNGLSVKLVPSN